MQSLFLPLYAVNIYVSILTFVSPLTFAKKRARFSLVPTAELTTCDCYCSLARSLDVSYSGINGKQTYSHSAILAHASVHVLLLSFTVFFFLLLILILLINISSSRYPNFTRYCFHSSSYHSSYNVGLCFHFFHHSPRHPLCFRHSPRRGKCPRRWC